MHFWQYLFIISFSFVFYNYAGYAILAFCLQKLIPIRSVPAAPPGSPADAPSISFIVAAYDEEALIREKILNSLGQRYPAERIEFIFVTDGSRDRTPAIVAEYPSIRLLHASRRAGKSAAVNRAVGTATHDILIFSDANTTLNAEAVQLIAGHYRDPAVGGVAGEKKVIALTGKAGASMDASSVSAGPNAASPDASAFLASASASSPGAGEGMYWKYESRLKKIDSDFYSVVGAAGELFSLRRELYEPLPEDTILDDFVLSLRAAQKGFRIIYEPGAYAMELPSFSIGEEQKRKVRIAAGGFQAIGMLRSLFLFWRHPRLSFLYISHRVLRWTLSPLCLILVFISNLILCFSPDNHIFAIIFGLQLAFYGIALLSLIPSFMNHRLGKIFKIPHYFTFMNVSVILGLFRFLKGRQSAVWEKARRAEMGRS